MSTEQQVRIAARLYDARDTLRRLLGDRYATVIEPVRAMIHKAQALNDCDEITAALWIVRRVDPSDGFEIMKILAAAVEMIEPTQVQHSGGTNER